MDEGDRAEELELLRTHGERAFDAYMKILLSGPDTFLATAKVYQDPLKAAGLDLPNLCHMLLCCIFWFTIFVACIQITCCIFKLMTCLHLQQCNCGTIVHIPHMCFCMLIQCPLLRRMPSRHWGRNGHGKLQTVRLLPRGPFSRLA